MPLANEFVKSGNWLFRWRSYVPIVLLVPLLLAMLHFDYLGHSHVWQEYWSAVCLSVSMLGLAVRVAAVGCAPSNTSGRNTAAQKADVLNTTGMYSIMRHPLYVGNFLIWLGIMMFAAVWWLIVIFLLAYWVYYERIMMAEESFLGEKFGAQYIAWADKTPAIIPKFRNWRRPALPFSSRTALKREYTALFGIAVAFFLLELSEHVLVEHQLVFEPHWTALFLSSAFAYAMLRSLKRHTRWLHVEGR